MKILKGKKRAYFIGIGGIGMSALARYLLNRGIEIYGYDKTETVLTKTLEDEGMNIHYEDRIDLIPQKIDIVVYTPAIPSDHSEKNWLIDQGHRLFKRSELLKEILNESKVIAVAGTHGKTSTSAILAHLLRNSEVSPTCFVGGIMVNYNTNFVFGDKDWVVIEADEYDRSFLRLFPTIAIINALDPDHLDIYGSEKEMVDSYRQFTGQIKEGGLLVVPNHVLIAMSEQWKEELKKKDIGLISFGEEGDDSLYGLENAVQIQSMTSKMLWTTLRLQVNRKQIELKIPFPGRHNALNAIGAAIVANWLGVEWKKIREQLETFGGIKRRFEVIYQSDNQIFIDDYAHHPEEIKAMVNGLRGCFPNSRITGIFQPHLYTRTRDFVDGFATELDKLDEVILLPIYPARELPIEGVKAAMIAERMKNEKTEILEKEELIPELKQRKIEVLVTLGAGDIDKMVPIIEEQIFTNS